MPNNRFKKKDQKDNSTVTRPNRNKPTFGRRPMHPSYLLQRAMRAPQTLTEEDRFHLRNQVDPQKLQDIFGGRTQPQQQNEMGGQNQQDLGGSTPDKGSSLSSMTPFASSGQTAVPTSTKPTSTSGGGGGDTIQRRFSWWKKSDDNKEEEDSGTPQETTTLDNDTDVGDNEESKSLPEELPQNVVSDGNSNELKDEPLDVPNVDNSETVNVNQLLENYKKGPKVKPDDGLDSSNEPGLFHKLFSGGNVGGRGERRTARYNTGYMVGSILNSVWSYITAAIKASLIGLVNVVSYGVSAIFSTIHACIAAFRAHRAKKRFKTADRLSSSAQHRHASSRGSGTSLDSEERAKYEKAKQELETWRKQHEKDVGEGGVGITGENSSSEDMQNMRFYAALEYFKKKTKRKRLRSIIESSSYAVSAVGGTAVGIGSVLAGAGLLTLLASNPVGWGIALTLAFAGTLFLIGSVIYAGIRKYRKKKQGKIAGRKRKFFAKEVVDLAAGGHQPSIAFLKDVGVLEGGTDMKSRGKFKVEDLNNSVKRPDLAAMFARKFSSWY